MGCRACGREERASEGYPCEQLRDLHLPHLHLPRRDAVPRSCAAKEAAAVVSRRHRPRRHRAALRRADPPRRAGEPAGPRRDRRRAGDRRRLAEGPHPARPLRRLGPCRLLRSRWRSRGGRRLARDARGGAMGASVRVGDAADAAAAARAGGARGRAVRLPGGRRGPVVDGHRPPAGRGGAGRAGQGARALGARALRRRALRMGRRDPVRRGLLGARPDHVPGARRAAAARLVPAGGLRRGSLPDAIRPGDLLFFRGDASERITHVAFAGEGGHAGPLHHLLGGMVQEPWLPGSRAASLRDRLVAVRRLEQR